LGSFHPPSFGIFDASRYRMIVFFFDISWDKQHFFAGDGEDVSGIAGQLFLGWGWWDGLR